MGFGSEIVVLLTLGFLLLGPKRLPAIFGHLARAKAQLKHATRSFATELEATLDSSHQQHIDLHAKPGGDE